MKNLQPKEEAFIRAYCNIASNTFGNGTASVKAAGYKVKNDDVASVYAVRLLGKDKVKLAMDELKGVIREAFKLDVEHYLMDLDRKLKAGGKDVKISREWILGLRVALEKEQMIGGGNKMAVQVNIGEACPTCGQTAGILAEALERIKRRRLGPDVDTPQIQDVGMLKESDTPTTRAIKSTTPTALKTVDCLPLESKTEVNTDKAV